MKIGFLVCPGTMPGSPQRRRDAYEHDLQIDAIRPKIQELGGSLVQIDWRAPIDSFKNCSIILVGTPWDYQNDEIAFINKLYQLENLGIPVYNPPDTVKWNSSKTYLKQLESRGVATIPTIWAEKVMLVDIDTARESFNCETIVVKRQVGAGAEGQSIHRPGSPSEDWLLLEPSMIQPFFHQVQMEGEYSFVFVDGDFCHAVIKKPKQGDYRVQSIYGGYEKKITPNCRDLTSAYNVIDALPLEMPLYARIDMIRGHDNQLMLMEAELIEPYLYPEQGPELGTKLTEGLIKRINRN